MAADIRGTRVDMLVQVIAMLQLCAMRDSRGASTAGEGRVNESEQLVKVMLLEEVGCFL